MQICLKTFSAMDSFRDQTHVCLEKCRKLQNIETLKFDAFRKFPTKKIVMTASAIKISIRKGWFLTRCDTAWRLKN